MTALSFEIDDAQAQAMLTRLIRSATDMRPALDRIGNALAEMARQRFDAGADPWGSPWAPLSPVTIARRRQGSAVPLRDTGTLVSTVMHATSATDVAVTVGRTDRPATVHQFGNPNNRMFGGPLAPIPARPFLPIREGRVDLEGTEERDVLLDVLDAYLGEAVAG